MKPQINEEDVVSAELRQLYDDNHIVPLWESTTAKTFGKPQEEAHIWRWSNMQKVVEETSKIRAAHVLDRRVLLMAKPGRHHVMDEAATGQIYCSFQLVLPGERAEAHRHPMSALRFVVQAPDSGASSIVDGKDCPMHPGDMIITPGWCWHEHVNEGDKPVIWLDVLDVGLHYVLDTAGFQPGPMRDAPSTLDDAVFVSAGITPRVDGEDYGQRPYSPRFRYAWEDAERALDAAPLNADGSREVRYGNPLTGGPSMSLLDSTLLRLQAGQPTRNYCSTASALFFVKEGSGSSKIGDKTIHWQANDMFTVPAKLWASHTADAGGACLFQVSNREVYRRLGLFSESFGD